MSICQFSFNIEDVHNPFSRFTPHISHNIPLPYYCLVAYPVFSRLRLSGGSSGAGWGRGYAPVGVPSPGRGNLAGWGRGYAPVSVPRPGRGNVAHLGPPDWLAGRGWGRGSDEDLGRGSRGPPHWLGGRGWGRGSKDDLGRGLAGNHRGYHLGK